MNSLKAFIKEYYSKSNQAYKYNILIIVIMILGIIINVCSILQSTLVANSIVYNFLEQTNLILIATWLVLWVISLPLLGKHYMLNYYEKPINYKKINTAYIVLTLINTLLYFGNDYFFPRPI